MREQMGERMRQMGMSWSFDSCMMLGRMRMKLVGKQHIEQLLEHRLDWQRIGVEQHSVLDWQRIGVGWLDSGLELERIGVEQHTGWTWQQLVEHKQPWQELELVQYIAW